MNDTNNNDSPEKKNDQVLNYEELLNGFTDSEGEESAEGDDGIVLSNLLDGIDSSDDKSELSEETDGIILDEISEINLDDITSDGIDIDSIESEPETEDESVQDTGAKKVEIEVDDDESESIDYSAILSELDNGAETENQDTSEDNTEPFESIDESAADEESSGMLIKEIALDIDEPETSYENLLGDDSDEDESAGEPEETAEPVENIDEPVADEESAETLIDEIALDIDEPESPYENLLSDDSDEDESAGEPEETAEPVESSENDMEPETSFASFTNDESSESSSEDESSVDELSFDNIYDGTDKEAFDKLTEDEFSLDDLASDSEDEEEFVLPQDTEEEPATAEIPALEESDSDIGASDDEVENAFVIGGDDDDDDSFLDLDDEEPPQEDDLLSSVTDAQDTAETEVLLDGIEMDAQEQITSVTRAELLIAQGKDKEAVEIYADVSDKKGVSPWVSKRLEQFNIGESAQESAPVEEAEAEES